jgi:MFS family permease
MLTNSQSDDRKAGIFSKQYLPLTLVNILVVISHAVNGYVTAVIAPSVVLDLGNPELMFWLFALFQVGSICAGVLAGNFKLRFGTRRIFVSASILLALGSIMGGMANSLVLVILARGIQGLSEGMLISLVYVALADYLPKRLLPRMMALSSTLWSIAAAVTPAFAGTLTQFVSWRAAFLFNIPLVLVLVVMAIFYLPRTEQIIANPKPIPFKRLGLLLSGLLTFGFAGQVQNTTLLALIIVISTIQLIGFAALDQRAEERFMPPNLFSFRTNMGLCFIILLCFSLGSSASNVYLVALLQSIWDLTPLAAGYTVALVAFSWTIFAWISNRIETERLKVLSIRLGAAAIFVGYLITAFGLNTNNFWVVCFSLIMVGAGFGSSSPLVRQIIMTQSPSEHKSIASGAMAPIQFTGAIVGAALAGFGAITVGLFDGTSADHVFTQQAASQSGSMLLLAFAAFAAMTVLAAANLRILRDENASEIVNSGA